MHRARHRCVRHGTDDESCHRWRSHVTDEWVMSQMNEPVISQINESYHIWLSLGTDKWVMSHGLLPRICTHNFIHMNASCRTYAYIFHTWHDLSVWQWCCVVGCITVCCSVFQCVAVFSVLHVTHMHTRFIFDMTHSSVTWLIHLCHESQVMQEWCMHMYAHVWHDSFMCDMTHSRVTWVLHLWRDSFIYDMSHSSMPWVISHASLVYAHVCASLKRHNHVWHDSFTCDTTHSCVTWLIYLCHGSEVMYDCCMHMYACVLPLTWMQHAINMDTPCVYIWMHHVRATWCMHIYVITREHVWQETVWHNSFICGMTHSSVAFIIHHGIRMYTYERVMSDSCMRYGTSASRDICYDVSRCTYS